MSDPAIHLYQIAFSEESLAQVEPGYAVLDNRANPRPDWYEYWPIRQFLLGNSLDDNAFYGFFSRKFRAKTGVTREQVLAFVQQHAANTDVLLFSPHPNQITFFLNVFDQGEHSIPGLMESSMEFLRAIGRPFPLHQLVMDAQQMVYSNYFVARPAFWREWLRWTEAIFAICEKGDTPLAERLTAPTAYTGGTQSKVFLVERIAPLLLAVQRQWRSKAHNPFANAKLWPTEAMRQDPSIALSCEALKLAFLATGYPQYIDAFYSARAKLLKGG